MEMEDERIIDESKRERIAIQGSENQLPFNSQDFSHYCKDSNPSMGM